MEMVRTELRLEELGLPLDLLQEYEVILPEYCQIKSYQNIGTFLVVQCTAFTFVWTLINDQAIGVGQERRQF